MSCRLAFETEQHFLSAVEAGGQELLLDSGLQGCVANFDGHGRLLGFKGTGKSGVNQQNPRGMGLWNPTSRKGRETWAPFFAERGGRCWPPASYAYNLAGFCAHASANPRGIRPWNPTSRKGRETWGTLFRVAGREMRATRQALPARASRALLGMDGRGGRPHTVYPQLPPIPRHLNLDSIRLRS